MVNQIHSSEPNPSLQVPGYLLPVLRTGLPPIQWLEKHRVILLFPLCLSLSLPYFFFARFLAKPKDFAHVFNSIYVINCLTSLVSTMTDVSKKLYQSLKQNKMTQSPGGKKKKESIGLKEKWLPGNSIHFLEGTEGRNRFSLTAPSPRGSWGKFNPVHVHCRLDQTPSFST